jgi:hypothetical protein
MLGHPLTWRAASGRPYRAAGGGALSANRRTIVIGKGLAVFVLPSPGKPAEVLAELGAAWPGVGVHVWGRVKGHGWWPAVVIKMNSDAAIPAPPNSADLVGRPET